MAKTILESKISLICYNEIDKCENNLNLIDRKTYLILTWLLKIWKESKIVSHLLYSFLMMSELIKIIDENHSDFVIPKNTAKVSL